MTDFKNLTGSSYAIVIVNLLFGILFKYKSIDVDIASFMIIFLILLIDIRSQSKERKSNKTYRKLIPIILFLLVVIWKSVFIPFPYV
ncbi:hypothetical protein ERAN111884_07990 [Erysipelothrix anatis]